MLINIAINKLYLPLPTCYGSNCQLINFKILIISDLIIIKKIKFLTA
jgi:hypothetical protein